MLKGALGGGGVVTSPVAQNVQKRHGPAGAATEKRKREMLDFSFPWAPHLLSMPLVGLNKGKVVTQKSGKCSQKGLSFVF